MKVSVSDTFVRSNFEIRKKKFFFSYDLDPMTLILKLYLGMVKTYLHTKMLYEGFKSYSLNRHDRKHYLPGHTVGN